ncbi:MAG: hypothetical protein WKF88_00670 [Ferruginibacter sp.]
MPYIITGSALITFLMFSVSKFQLPHYIVIIFPHFAMMSGNFIAGLRSESNIRRWSISLSVLLFLTGIVITALAFYSGMGRSFFALFPAIAVCIAAILVFRRHDPGILVAKGIFFSVALFWYLNGFFYPALLQYRAGVQAAKVFNSLNLPEAPYMLNRYSRAFELYSKTQPVYILTGNPDSVKVQAPAIMYILETDLFLVDSAGYKYEVIKRFDDFRVTRLTAGFLNEKTRDEHVTRNSLIKIYAVP